MPAKPSPTILVVDDNEPNRYAMARTLRKAGLNVVEAGTGEEGLHEVKSEQPDLVILDVNLPDTSGFEVCRVIKADPGTSAIPVLHVSATMIQAENKVRGLEGGAEGYLTHPFEPPVLLATVNSLLRLRQAEMEREQYIREVEALNLRLQRAMQESHHRIKNNLQVLSALVETHILDGEEMIPVSALHRIAQHMRSLSTLHDLLTQEVKTDADVDSISVRDALDQLTPMVQSTSERTINVTYLDDVRLSIKEAGSFVVLVNELISNAIKHGAGNIEVSLSVVAADSPRRKGGKAQAARLEITDEGAGFPADFDPRNAANTGMELIESMCRWDLQGDIVYENRPEGGARVVVTFPLTANSGKEEADPSSSSSS